LYRYIPEKAENHRLASLKERVQARLNDEEKQALAAIKEKEEEVIRAQGMAEAERLKAEKATILIKVGAVTSLIRGCDKLNPVDL
jgi:regulator of protease activity HflC (stomatin/prohibitin superfamily)